MHDFLLGRPLPPPKRKTESENCDEECDSSHALIIAAGRESLVELFFQEIHASLDGISVE